MRHTTIVNNNSIVPEDIPDTIASTREFTGIGDGIQVYNKMASKVFL